LLMATRVLSKERTCTDAVELWASQINHATDMRSVRYPNIPASSSFIMA